MSSSMQLRSNDVLFDIKLGEDEFTFKVVGPIDYTKGVRIPTYQWSYERYFTVLNGFPQNYTGRKREAIIRVAKELTEVYLYADLCPASEDTIKARLEKRVKKITDVRSELNRKNRRQNEQFLTTAKLFFKDLNWGTDIFNSDRQDYLGIKVGTDEFKLYEDNCIPKVVDGKEVVAYQAIIEGTMHPSTKMAVKRLEKLRSLDTYYGKIRSDGLESNQMVGGAAVDALNECEQLGEASTNGSDYIQESPEHSEEDVPDKRRRLSNVYSDRDRELRSKTKSVSNDSTTEFPQIPVRNSFKTFNPDILEQLARLESTYRIPARVSRELLVDIANNLFNQKWVVLPENKEERENQLNDQEEDLPESRLDWRYIMPSRKAVRDYIYDAAILNFQYIAEYLMESKAAGAVLTLGTDDTVKLAGRKAYDVKTGVVTVINPSEDGKKKRKTLSLGFKENVSHKGVDAAETVRSFLGQVGASIDRSAEDVLEMFDFFMGDRASDNDVMLDSLEISEDARLNCNAHILLCVTATADKVFRDFESSIGVHKLVGEGALSNLRFKNSIWYLGLNAFSKLLSPSKAQESISLFKEYKGFLVEVMSSNDYIDLKDKAESLLSKCFLGFSSNRFGRLADLSSLYLDHESVISEFYKHVVDENQNQLHLACFYYLNSQWFMLCCKIVGMLNTLFVSPLRLALGIDEYKKKRSEHRSWFGLKERIPELLHNLESATDKDIGQAGCALLTKVCNEVSGAVKRQMSTVKFYTDEGLDEEKLMKLPHAPLTNSGCESNFGDMTYDMVRSAGSDTQMQTFSNKNIVRKNKLFDSDRWKNMSAKERSAKWRWARSSAQAKKVRQMGCAYMDKVKAANVVGLAEKEKKKQKKMVRALNLLEKCKGWGGPVTESSIGSLKSLTENQLLTEVRYLRATIAPNIREKRKEGNKFVKFNKEELMFQVKNCIKPTADIAVDVESLILNALGLNVENESQDDDESNVQEDLPEDDSVPTENASNESKDSTLPAGLLGQFSGPLGEVKVGVVITVGRENMLQIYDSKRYGFVPALSKPEVIDEWELLEEIEEYQYVQYPSTPGVIFLKF